MTPLAASADGVLDRLAALAARIFGVPIAIVSVVHPLLAGEFGLQFDARLLVSACYSAV
ncbi:hypothetical protein [Cryobacterium fucosi]|uniref:hypothetical protein n=1 Tax=Cryobacterium fucosi TaxID=1259157 RepID=UPI001581DBE1|nr:hypothetical protein [Cryobacterium fucosi]